MTDTRTVTSETSERVMRVTTAEGQPLAYQDMGGLVRCRDCEHARVLHPLNPITGVPAGIEDWRCDYFWNADELPEVEPDGFCAWGERRDDE